MTTNRPLLLIKHHQADLIARELREEFPAAEFSVYKKSVYYKGPMEAYDEVSRFASGIRIGLGLVAEWLFGGDTK